MSMHANALEMHVAVMTAPKSIPQPESTAGWTNMMYDIVKNVVEPATVSVLVFVPFCRSLNIFPGIHFYLVPESIQFFYRTLFNIFSAGSKFFFYFFKAVYKFIYGFMKYIFCVKL